MAESGKLLCQTFVMHYI